MLKYTLAWKKYRRKMCNLCCRYVHPDKLTTHYIINTPYYCCKECEPSLSYTIHIGNTFGEWVDS